MSHHCKSSSPPTKHTHRASQVYLSGVYTTPSRMQISTANIQQLTQMEAAGPVGTPLAFGHTGARPLRRNRYRMTYSRGGGGGYGSISHVLPRPHPTTDPSPAAPACSRPQCRAPHCSGRPRRGVTSELVQPAAPSIGSGGRLFGQAPRRRPGS